ncbi:MULTISPECIES: phage tail tape measure protein [Pseudomonas]|uniref:phage tail tape measure protein n=1 Tax=Pseudomonas asiatica TaxID=2219225 RepID=UPI000CD44EB3|nr:phage tail tape measure protein [Pseudomonas putida]POF86249.1 phage tail tape measure protein [Pseudomonas putida]RFQ02127.1 phage tail tape measure protein [Pseudomonas putida]
MSANASSRLDFILALTDKVTAPLAKVTNSFNDLAEKSEANIKQIGTGVAGLWGSLTGIEASLEPALEVNRALGDVRSLGVAENALDALNQKSLEFSIQYGENAQEFVASAYKIEGAIKGLAGSQLATFTNTSSVLAKATKSDKDVMGEYIGTMYNLQKQQADAMGKNEWVEKLGGQTALAVELFRTSGEQIKDAFKESGAIATAAGIDMAEQMAVIGTLSSTMEGGDAGGRYKAFFENIANASDKLGMKFTDTNDKVLPMTDILAKLEKKFGDLSGAAANAKIVEAFGGEGAQVIGALASDTDRFKNGLDQLGKVRGLEQAEKMAAAMVDPWQQFGAAVQALRIAFGQALIPILQPLMTRLVDIGKVLMRWTKLFPNIARVVGIVTLVVLGITAALSALTIVVGLSKMAWLGMTVVWSVFTWTGWKSIAMFIRHTVVLSLFTVRLIAMFAWMGIVKVAMLAWQGVIWLVNAAMYANPIGVVIAGIVALVAVIAVVIVYWEDIKKTIMDTAAFQWAAEQLQALGAWFDSVGGWSGAVSAAWDGIVAAFKSAIAKVIDLLNKIPGVNIDATFADVAAPKVPEIPGQTVPVGVMPIKAAEPPVNLPTPQQLLQVPQRVPLLSTVPAAAEPPAPMAKALKQEPKPQLQQVPPALAKLPAQPAASTPVPTPPVLKLVPPVPTPLASLPLAATPSVPVATVTEPPEAIGATLKTLAALPQPPVRVEVDAPSVKVEQAREGIAQAAPSLAPTRPVAVPKGGLMSSIQNTTQSADRRIHVEKVEINTSKPLTPLELENMVGMAVG